MAPTSTSSVKCGGPTGKVHFLEVPGQCGEYISCMDSVDVMERYKYTADLIVLDHR